MLAITHTLISLPFAVYLQNPFLIFIAAFGWHLLADTLLHWNLYPDVWKKYFYPLVAIDVLGGLVAAYLLIGHNLFSIRYLAAIAGGNMPDILQALWDILGSKRQDQYFPWAKPWFRFHDNLQLETKSVRYGLIAQIVLVLLTVSII